tara:strand:- start:29 stop:244 length:216 start_codon:yes stop_codon:yes gene_type:complete
LPLKKILRDNMLKLKVNDKVNYHCFAGGEVSSTDHVIKSIDLKPNNYGEDVAFITNKSGCVSLEHLSINNK